MFSYKILLIILKSFQSIPSVEVTETETTKDSNVNPEKEVFEYLAYNLELAIYDDNRPCQFEITAEENVYVYVSEPNRNAIKAIINSPEELKEKDKSILGIAYYIDSKWFFNNFSKNCTIKICPKCLVDIKFYNQLLEMRYNFNLNRHIFIGRKKLEGINEEKADLSILLNSDGQAIILEDIEILRGRIYNSKKIVKYFLGFVGGHLKGISTDLAKVKNTTDFDVGISFKVENLSEITNNEELLATLNDLSKYGLTNLYPTQEYYECDKVIPVKEEGRIYTLQNIELLPEEKRVEKNYKIKDSMKLAERLNPEYTTTSECSFLNRRMIEEKEKLKTDDPKKEDVLEKSPIKIDESKKEPLNPKTKIDEIPVGDSKAKIPNEEGIELSKVPQDNKGGFEETEVVIYTEDENGSYSIGLKMVFIAGISFMVLGIGYFLIKMRKNSTDE